MEKIEHIFNLPDLGEGLTSGDISECNIAVGDEVVTDQVAMVIETTKAAVELPMPFGGKVVAIHGKLGDTIDVGKPLITLLTDEAPASPDPAPETVTHLVGQATAAVRAGNSGPSLAERMAKKKKAKRGRVLPAVRLLARELGIDLAHVTGTGDGGAILETDVRQYANAHQSEV